VTVSSGTPALVPAPLEYRGIGYDAVMVSINHARYVGALWYTLRVSGDRSGSLENPLPGTPIAWRSLDRPAVRVPDVRAGKSWVAPIAAPRRIVAELLTGPADTMVVNRATSAGDPHPGHRDSQSAPPLALLPQPPARRVWERWPARAGTRAVPRARSRREGQRRYGDEHSLASLRCPQRSAAGIGQQNFDARVNASPPGWLQSLRSERSGGVGDLDRTVDNHRRGATLQYNAVARDSLGNPVSVTIGWTSTVTSVRR